MKSLKWSMKWPLNVLKSISPPQKKPDLSLVKIVRQPDEYQSLSETKVKVPKRFANTMQVGNSYEDSLPVRPSFWMRSRRKLNS